VLLFCAQDKTDPAEWGALEEEPPRVWVLLGGDSAQRQASLASGLAAWLRLRTQPDLQA
jgi:hypothetical protein